VRRKAILLITAVATLTLVCGTALAITYTTSTKPALKLNKASFVGTALTKLASNAVGPALTVGTHSTDPEATPLSLDTNNGSQAPVQVDSEAKVTNLNSDKLDDFDSNELPGTIAHVGTFAGPVRGFTLGLRNASWYFAGPTRTVTTTANQRLVGSAQAPLRLADGTSEPRTFSYGLCYQQTDGEQIANFVGSHPSLNSFAEIDTAQRSYAAAASVVPGAGTWRVGFCVGHDNRFKVDMEVPFATSESVSGWVQVVNQSPTGVAAASASENVEESNESQEQP
jgi:hypothetical protein